ncbi:MAG: hypothetical protein WDA18_02260 [Candidatus Ratteibacteria bacterium]
MKKLLGIVLGAMIFVLMVSGCKKPAPAPEMMQDESVETMPEEVPAEEAPEAEAQ